MKKVLIFILTLAVANSLFADNNVTFPKEYKEWKHIKTMVIKEKHPMVAFRGIHHIYANDIAYKGYLTGVFEDGSVIALDLLNYEDVNETISESSRIYVAVMEKDEKKYAKTNGWGYEAFKTPSDRLVVDVNKMCLNCHQSQKKNGFVFSKLRK